MGGLCNRMRAIDGFLTYATENKRPLTIIWINNNKLNCSFQDIFDPLNINHVTFLELNPDVSFSDRVKVNLLNFVEQAIFPFARRVLLGLALGNFHFRKTKVNPEWAGIYNSNEFAATQSMRETEAFFYQNTRNVLDRLLTEDPVYISSCYRLFKSSDRYKRFVPTKSIREQISGITSKFSNTVGLHIRAHNHPYASKYSTAEKFEDAITGLLKQDPYLTFFLATDSGKVKEKLISKFGAHLILTNPTDVYARSDAEAIKQAVVDLYCLAKSKKVFGSHYSSFTLTAADIGNLDEIIVK